MKWLCWAFALVLLGTAAEARERIERFHADITVGADGIVTVAETIAVLSLGHWIRRGIVREFPTLYEEDYQVEFEAVSLTRNGAPEPYKVSKTRTGVDIRFGSEDVNLAKGQHVYVFTYRVKGVVSHFEQVDELYWNVTGNGWTFPIDQAEAVVRLPEGVVATALGALAGAEGSETKDARIRLHEDNTVTAEATRPLEGLEGLTIIVHWPPGAVLKHDMSPGFLSLWMAAFPGVLALLATLAVLVTGWFRAGRDPDPGTIIPLFRPPPLLSAADARYLDRLKFDEPTLAVAILDIVSRGAAALEPGAKAGRFLLRRIAENGDGLPADLRATFERLFRDSTVVEMGKGGVYELTGASGALAVEMWRRHDGDHVRQNDGWLAAPGLLLLIGFIATFMLGTKGSPAAWIGLGAVAAGALAMAVFRRLLRAPTEKGQELRAQLAGLKMYLNAAETARWEVFNPPRMTPEQFDRLFPYALALGLDQKWSAAFEREMRLDPVGGGAAASRFSTVALQGAKASALVGAVRANVLSTAGAGRANPGRGGGSGGRVGGGFGGGGGRGW